MKFAALVFFASLIPAFASASPLVYRIDLERSQMDANVAFDLCGLPERMSLDPEEDLATAVIQRTLAFGLRDLKIQFIQATRGSIFGGGLEEPYQGKYRVGVGLVNVGFSEAYRGGVFQRVEVITYGSTTAPKAFTVDVELLNYRESAELAEGSICTGFAYTLQ